MTYITELWIMRTIILPAADVLLLAFIIYKGYQILVQTRAAQLMRGAAFIGITYAAAYIFDLRTLLWLINLLAPSLVVGILIIFQPELRKIFTRIGQGRLLAMGSGSQPLHVESVISAAEILSYRRRGALVVFGRSVGLKNIVETGTHIEAALSSALLLTIFGHDTALHDGAVVIEGERIVAAGCFLPLSEQLDVRRSFGTRHRAALGLVEETDAVVLIVSEETGAISLAYDASLYYDLTAEEARKRLQELLRSGAREPATETQEVSAFEA